MQAPPRDLAGELLGARDDGAILAHDTRTTRQRIVKGRQAKRGTGDAAANAAHDSLPAQARPRFRGAHHEAARAPRRVRVGITRAHHGAVRGRKWSQGRCRHGVPDQGRAEWPAVDRRREAGALGGIGIRAGGQRVRHRARARAGQARPARCASPSSHEHFSGWAPARARWWRADRPSRRSRADSRAAASGEEQSRTLRRHGGARSERFGPPRRRAVHRAQEYAGAHHACDRDARGLAHASVSQEQSPLGESRKTESDEGTRGRGEGAYASRPRTAWRLTAGGTGLEEV